MFSQGLFLTIFIVSTRINSIDSLQCYECTCSRNPGESNCKNQEELKCSIQYVENNYCYVTFQESFINFGHAPNSDLNFLKSAHYVQTKEEFFYDENNRNWSPAKITQVSYGCNWNLCNTPQIRELLPKSFSYRFDENLLNDLLIPELTDTLKTCHSCSLCVDEISQIQCNSSECSGICTFDEFLGESKISSKNCPISFESKCSTESAGITLYFNGYYYIDDRLSDIAEIDIKCRKTNCNSWTNVEQIRNNAVYTATISDQLFFRPSGFSSTTPPTANEQLACYSCYSQHPIELNSTIALTCTIEYQNATYCEIVRNFVEFSNQEITFLGHVQRDVQRYRHFILAEETFRLYENNTWQPSFVDRITYVCDWPLCNDPRIVNKLLTSFQFNPESPDIVALIQNTNTPFQCFDCRICSNLSSAIENCSLTNCQSNGRCFISELIDDPQADDCEYLYTTSCEPGASESGIDIIATYGIDDDELDIDQMDVYCSVDKCNQPSTVFQLINLMKKDIKLDSTFFFRPVTTPTSVTTAQSTTIDSSSTSVVRQTLFVHLLFFLLSAIVLF